MLAGISSPLRLKGLRANPKGTQLRTRGLTSFPFVTEES
jgi:hypothetical protein